MNNDVDFDFDADDLVDAILGEASATPDPDAIAEVPTQTPLDGPQTPPPSIGRNLGWFLGWMLIIAVLVAIGLATRSGAAAQPLDPDPICGGLFDTECCVDWHDNWGACPGIDDRSGRSVPCIEQTKDNRRGLFDAEHERAAHEC